MERTPKQYLPGLTAPTTAGGDAVFRKVLWRLLPFLFLGYVINTIDRANVAFAKLRMTEDIALTDAAYGIGAGIFYLGYILFEVPSNMYMQRVGARATLTRIMVLWGLVTIATAFVSSPTQLIAARFFLGIAEAGFFPGVILYLTYWFPPALRARITAVLLMAAMTAGILSGPLAGSIMAHLNGLMGLRDWQVLFVLEGIPAVLLGIFGWFWLTDRPCDARWLDSREKQMIATALAAGKASAQAAAWPPDRCPSRTSGVYRRAGFLLHLQWYQHGVLLDANPYPGLRPGRPQAHRHAIQPALCLRRHWHVFACPQFR
jgi:MFS family permease